MHFHPTLVRLCFATLAAIGSMSTDGGGVALAQSAAPPEQQASAPSSANRSTVSETDRDPPICTIDGEPVYRSEWVALLRQRLGADNVEEADPLLRQAVALTLVRRRLAMQTLESLGGESLQALIERRIQAAEQDAERQGESLADQIARRGGDRRAWRRQLAWEVAWTEFLKTRLTSENLRQFFTLNPQRDDGTRLQLSQIFLPQEQAGLPAKAEPPVTMQTLVEQLSGAEDVEATFAMLAKQHSAAGSASEGGLIGWVETRGDLPPELIDAALRAIPKTVIGPVRSSLGWHLLFVHQIEAGSRTFEEIPDQGPLRRDATAAIFRALVRQQADADVEWLEPSLQPPVDASIIP